MKLQELIKLAEEGKNVEDNIKVDNYMTTSTKTTIMDSVLLFTVAKDENNLFYCNPVEVELWTKLLLVQNLTDIELPELYTLIEGENEHYDIDKELAYQVFDQLNELDVFYTITKSISNFNFFDLQIEEYISSRLKLQNSLAATVSRLVEKFLSKIPDGSLQDLLTQLPEMAKNLDNLPNKELIENTLQDAGRITPVKNRATRRKEKKDKE